MKTALRHFSLLPNGALTFALLATPLVAAQEPHAETPVTRTVSYDEAKAMGLEELASLVTPEYRALIGEAQRGLAGDAHYAVMLTADWCYPCILLKQELARQGLLDQVRSISVDKDFERAWPGIFYAKRVLKQYEGALPELLIRQGGETASYYGFNARFRTVTCSKTGAGIGVAELFPSPEDQHD